MVNDINMSINSVHGYGYNLSRTSYDVRQEINAKVIGVLKSNNVIRKNLLNRNIGIYPMINNEEGIGYISNLYSLESSKPISLDKEGLLGYTHTNYSDFQSSINQKYDIGDFIKYYSHGSLPDSNTRKWNGLYNDYTEYINEVYGFKYTSLNILQNLFSNNKLYGTIDSKTNLTIQSVLYDFLQYDNLKYAMEKNRIGTINPNPLAALAGSITTNINNFTGKDTALGMITNHLYAHALHNGAKFNSLRKTNYITPEVYEFIGNKLSTLSTLSSDYRINENTGRLSFDLGGNFNGTKNIEDTSINDIEKDIIDSTIDVANNKNAFYRNITRNNNFLDIFGENHERYSPFNPYFNAKIYKNGRMPENINSLLSQTIDDELNSLSEYIDLLSEDIVSEKIYNNDSARYFNYLENVKKEGQTNRYLPFENDQYKVFQTTISSLQSFITPTVNSKIYKIWNEGDKGNWNEEVYTYTVNDEYNSISIDNSTSNILSKTQELFRSHNKNGIDTLIGRYHTSGGRDVNHNEANLMQTAVSKFGLSHGRNLLNKKAYEESLSTIDKNGYSNPYCRVWTYHNQYSKIGDLIRPFSKVDDNGNSSIISVDELQKNYWKFGRVKGSAQRLKDNSSLNRNGFVNITPIVTTTDNNTHIDVRKCMFSIENLAWLDVEKRGILSQEQIGPNGGRIMWFPPYDLDFNETVGVDWNQTEFIGRGEKIYTYKNTERSGTLSFALLVDHPSVLDMWKKNNKSGNDSNDEQTLLRFFAGCEELEIDNVSFKPSEPPVPQKPEPKIVPIIEDPTPEPKSEDIIFYIFFPNNFSGKYMDIDTVVNYLTTEYESDSVRNVIRYPDTKYKWTYFVDDVDVFINENLDYESNYNDTVTFKLNKDINSVRKDNSFKDATISFYDFMYNNKVLYGKDVLHATVQGFASSHGKTKNNKELSDNRGLFAKSLLTKFFNAKSIESLEGSTIDVNTIDKNNVSGESAKRSRCVKVVIDKTVQKLKTEGINDLTIENSEDESLISYISYIPNTTIEVDRPKLSKKQKRIKKRDERKNKEEYEALKSESIRNKMNEQLIDSLNSLKSNNNIEAVSPSPNFEKMISDRMSSNFKVGLGTKYEEVTSEEVSSQRWDNESQYFTMLKDNDSFLYNRLIDKIKYFTPAFHSITPEGFNARLSFLHQCTRQGMTNSASDSDSKTITSAGNLAFGRPPVCVLRIGDFYNTKIVIDSITINYEKPQWDMNTEGIGMQPLFARISLSFKFLGGSDLTSPISKLQNAITFNYYANQSIYDDRSDIGK